MSDLGELVRELMDRGGESRDLDFKGPMTWPPTWLGAKWGLVKDILAFANTPGGGHLLIGVEDVTGRLIGLSDGDRRTWDQSAVHQAVESHASPPPDFTVRGQEVEPGKWVVLVSVREFVEVFHICSEGVEVNGKEILRRGGIYIRTVGAESVLMDDVEQVRDLVGRAVARSPEYAAAVAKIQAAPPMVTQAYDDALAGDRQAMTDV
jgi:predicted HTH transcriptional regulator